MFVRLYKCKRYSCKLIKKRWSDPKPIRQDYRIIGSDRIWVDPIRSDQLPPLNSILRAMYGLYNSGNSSVICIIRKFLFYTFSATKFPVYRSFQFFRIFFYLLYICSIRQLNIIPVLGVGKLFQEVFKPQ